MLELTGFELKELLKNIIDIKDVYFDKATNFIKIKGFVYIYIFGIRIAVLAKFWIKRIGIGKYAYKDQRTSAVFIDFMSKNIFFEYVFKILYKRYIKYGIDFSSRQEKAEHGPRYYLAIRGPEGIEYFYKNYKTIADLFKIDSCSNISWSFKENKIVFSII